MTRPNLLLGALAAVCGGTLLWCARLILAADLPLGAHIASWCLWVVAAVAVLTLFAYVREFLRHRQQAGRDASWKPLPSLVLLWIGGLTALLSFAFILPNKAAADGAAPARAETSSSGQAVTPAPVSTTAVSSTSRPATSSTSSRSVASRTAPPAPVSTAPQGSPTSRVPAPRASTTTSTPSTTSSPLVSISIFPTQSQRTKTPGH